MRKRGKLRFDAGTPDDPSRRWRGPLCAICREPLDVRTLGRVHGNCQRMAETLARTPSDRHRTQGGTR